MTTPDWDAYHRQILIDSGLSRFIEFTEGAAEETQACTPLQAARMVVALHKANAAIREALEEAMKTCSGRPDGSRIASVLSLMNLYIHTQILPRYERPKADTKPVDASAAETTKSS